MGGSNRHFIHVDLERGPGVLTTTVCTVFSVAGDLIGVAGITIYLESLGRLSNPVKNALQSRVTGYSAPTKPVILTAANCSLVNETTQPCGADSAYYAANGGLCAKTDLTSTIQDLTCCGACSTVSNGSGHNLHNARALAGVVIGSLVGFVLLVSCGLCALRGYQRRKRRLAEENYNAIKHMEIFPGDTVPQPGETS